jgi:hypothetical protein
MSAKFLAGRRVSHPRRAKTTAATNAGMKEVDTTAASVTGPHRSGDERGRSPRLSNTSQTVTRRPMEVIRHTPVRNEA